MTTVNELVREFLASFARVKGEPSEAEREKARRKLVELSERSTGRLGPNWKWNRAELYESPRTSEKNRQCGEG